MRVARLLPLFYFLLFSLFYGILCTRELNKTDEPQNQEKRHKQEARSMDFSFIKALTNRETAQKLCDYEYFNDHIGNTAGEAIDGEALDDLLKGAVVLGAAPVDYPVTDAVYLYFELKTGKIITVLIEPAGNEEDGAHYGCSEPLYIGRIDIE